MDEKPYHLLNEARQFLPIRPSNDLKADTEYVRSETNSIIIFTVPGSFKNTSVRKHRITVDRAEEIKYLVDKVYPYVSKIIFVMDNLICKNHMLTINVNIKAACTHYPSFHI